MRVRAHFRNSQVEQAEGQSPFPKQPSGNPVRHEYVSVKGKSFSFQGADNMAWTQGRIDNNEYSDNCKCNMFSEDEKFE